jgi:hypothetical protein
MVPKLRLASHPLPTNVVRECENEKHNMLRRRFAPPKELPSSIRFHPGRGLTERVNTFETLAGGI